MTRAPRTSEVEVEFRRACEIIQVHCRSLCLLNIAGVSSRDHGFHTSYFEQHGTIPGVSTLVEMKQEVRVIDAHFPCVWCSVTTWHSCMCCKLVLLAHRAVVAVAGAAASPMSRAHMCDACRARCAV